MENYNLRSNLKILRTTRKKSVPELLKEADIDISPNTYLSYEDTRANSPKYPVARALSKYYSNLYDMEISIESLYEDDYTAILEEEIKANDKNELENASVEKENDMITLKRLEIQKLEAETAKIKAEIELYKLTSSK